MNDAKLTDCPEAGCDGLVKRLLGTGAGLIFKGGGFYQTDYRSESYKAGEKKESESMKKKSDSGKTTGAAESSKSAQSKPNPTKQGD